MAAGEGYLRVNYELGSPPPGLRRRNKATKMAATIRTNPAIGRRFGVGAAAGTPNSKGEADSAI